MTPSSDKPPIGEENSDTGTVTLIPTLEDYQKRYASTIEEDKKAVVVFKTYESQEKVRRLQTELAWIKEGKVKESTCNRVIGKKRKGKYQSYSRWASLMLLWLSQHKN